MSCASCSRPTTPMSQSDISLISPKVEGYIKEVRVADNQEVGEGEVLFVIDDRDFAAKVAQAEAAVATAEATVVDLWEPARLAAGDDRRGAGDAGLRRSRSVPRTAGLHALQRADVERFRQPAAFRAGAKPTPARPRRPSPRAGPRWPPRRISSPCCARSDTRKRAGGSKPAPHLQLARNDLDNTVIRAPISGVAGNRAGQVGQYVKPGTQLLSLVPLSRVYVTANFKETQLTHMRPGQVAEVSVDAYPDRTLEGRDRELRAGERRPVQPVAAGQRDRQFHQDRAARPGAHRAPGEQSAGRAAAPGSLGHRDDRYQGCGGGRRARRRGPGEVGEPEPQRNDLGADLALAAGADCAARRRSGTAETGDQHRRPRRPPREHKRRCRPCATGSASSPWSSACSWRSWTCRS